MNLIVKVWNAICGVFNCEIDLEKFTFSESDLEQAMDELYSRND